MTTVNAWLVRGSYYYGTVASGIYRFGSTNGNALADYSFRIVMSPSL